MKIRLRRYLRKQVPRGERVASIVIVVLLVVVAVAVAVTGRHYDPARYQISIEPARVGTELVGPAPSPVDSGELTIAISGLKPIAPTEHYTPETLYIKINGRDELFLAFDVQSLRCRTFAPPDDPGQFVEVYLYDMGTPAGAFGVFAGERDPAGEALDFSADGYRSGASVFMRRGAFYIQILTADNSEVLHQAAGDLARSLAAAYPDNDAGLAGRRALPEDGKIPNSDRYVASNALSTSFLEHVFFADYMVGDAKIAFFITEADDAATAAVLLDRYRDFLNQYGAAMGDIREINDTRMFEAESYDQWDVIFQRGKMLGGVTQADDADAAHKFVERYLKEPLVRNFTD